MKMVKTKTFGYVVSSPKHRNGKYVKTMTQAKQEMYRQIRSGASQSGVREVYKQEWNASIKRKSR